MSVIEDALRIVVQWMGEQRREFQRNMARSIYWAQRRLRMTLTAILQQYPERAAMVNFALPAGLPNPTVAPLGNTGSGVRRNTRRELIAILRRIVERIGNTNQPGIQGPGY